MDDDRWDYRPQDGTEPVFARVILDARTWHPTKPGMLRFDATITKCNRLRCVKIGGKSLKHHGKPWLVGAWDSFTVKGEVTLEMIGMFARSFDLADAARVEGLSITPMGKA